MSAGRTSDGSDGKPKTLGDLLYADKTKPRVPEQEWVELVRSIAAHDQAALHSLYERSHRLVFTLTMRITGNRETAEELTLDVFHDIWLRADRYDPADGPVLGWILNQARSRAIDRIRFETRKKRVDPRTHTDVAFDEGHVDDSVDAIEQSRFVRNVLGVLTADERRAVETAFFAGATYAEVATQLRVPLGTVKTRIRSGLAKLRQALTVRGRDESM